MGALTTAATLPALLPALLPSEGDGFHAPTIMDLFPEVFAFAGTPFALDRVMMIRLVMMLVLIVCLVLYATRAKLVPGRAQFALEFLFDFTRKSISEEIIGKELGRKYSPIVTSIFFTVLFMNIAGIIPGFNLAGTAKPGFPLLLAVFAWFVFVYAGIRETGLGRFLKSSLFPPGVPWPLYILLTPIEAISTFIIRPFTLFVRLLANMIAGHFLLALTLSASNFFLFTLLSQQVQAVSLIGILTFIAAFAFTLFEILVAFLQAYIFAVLTAVYVNLSVHAH